MSLRVILVMLALTCLGFPVAVAPVAPAKEPYFGLADPAGASFPSDRFTGPSFRSQGGFYA